MLHDLRGRVKAARAAISGTPGAEEVLRRDWVKAAHFFARFGITESELRHGAPAIGSLANEGTLDDVQCIQSLSAGELSDII